MRDAIQYWREDQPRHECGCYQGRHSALRIRRATVGKYHKPNKENDAENWRTRHHEDKRRVHCENARECCAQEAQSKVGVDLADISKTCLAYEMERFRGKGINSFVHTE